MTRSDELKPCPKCQSVNIRRDYEGCEDDDFFLRCGDCGLRGKTFCFPHLAVEWWNAREALTRSNELDDPKMLAKIGTAIAEAVGDQGFELSPPQALYAALQAVGAINAASLTRSNDTIEDEPTEAMVEAGMAAYVQAGKDQPGNGLLRPKLPAIYKAMRAAITPE